MRKFDTINVIPFIDIMLVLLAIVLTTATFISNGQLDIALPAASSTAELTNDEKVEIAIDRHAILFFNGGVTTIAEIRSELELLQISTRIELVIDESAEFKEFVAIIDLLNELSMDKVSVITRKNN